MRHVLAVVAAGAAAAVGGLVLGEYELVGPVGVLVAVLFGVVVAEVALAVVRRPPPALSVPVGLLSAAGFAWAVWIFWRRSGPAPASGWVAAVVAGVVAAAWLRRFRRTAPGSPPAPSPSGDGPAHPDR